MIPLNIHDPRRGPEMSVSPQRDRIDWLGVLGGVVAEWCAVERPRWSSDEHGPVAELILRPTDPSKPTITLELDTAGARQLAWDLRREILLGQERARSDARIDEMAAVLVAEARAGGDVGILLATSCAAAARQLPDAEQLVAGRPGSWEASIIRTWAATFEPRASSDRDQFERADILVGYLIEMAERREDGGDVVSQAIGRAVTQLGSMQALAAGSVVEADLRNIGGQYTQVSDGWPT